MQSQMQISQHRWNAAIADWSETPSLSCLWLHFPKYPQHLREDTPQNVLLRWELPISFNLLMPPKAEAPWRLQLSPPDLVSTIRLNSGLDLKQTTEHQGVCATVLYCTVWTLSITVAMRSLYAVLPDRNILHP